MTWLFLFKFIHSLRMKLNEILGNHQWELFRKLNVKYVITSHIVDTVHVKK